MASGNCEYNIMVMYRLITVSVQMGIQSGYDGGASGKLGLGNNGKKSGKLGKLVDENVCECK